MNPIASPGDESAAVVNLQKILRRLLTAEWTGLDPREQLLFN